MRTESLETAHLCVVGAGGHAKVVVDALLCLDFDSGSLCLVDDDPERWGSSVLGLTVHGPLKVATAVASVYHVAIGHNVARERAARSCLEAGLLARTIVHPRASLAASSRIDDGCFIAAHSVVGPAARLGAHCIVNHAAVVDHDNIIGSCSHIAPHATLGGGVSIGNRTLIGAGATVRPGVSIGDDCIVGAGAVVLRNVPSGTTVVGVPARRLGVSGS